MYLTPVYKPAQRSKIHPVIDEENLKRAALVGDVRYLKLAFAIEAPDNSFYLTVFQDTKHYEGNCTLCGNILHLAASKGEVDFVEVVLQTLSPQHIHQLLMQPRCAKNKFNPLYVAVETGNTVIVNLFLDVYRSYPHFPTKPWLVPGIDLPLCHYAIRSSDTKCINEKCALDVLSMDMDYFCNTPDSSGVTLLSEAVAHKFRELALKILRSETKFLCVDRNNTTALCYVSLLTETPGKEMCGLLLEKMPEIVKLKKRDDNQSVFHYWVKSSKAWPFEFVLKKNDTGIKAEVRRDFVDLISATDNNGYSPLHLLAIDEIDERIVVQIAKILVNAYNEELKDPASSIISQVSLPWLAETKDGKTFLSLALDNKHQDLAIYILSENPDTEALQSNTNLLFRALENGLWNVADKILEIVDREEQKLFNLLTRDDGLHVMHLAPYHPNAEKFLGRLLKMNPPLMDRLDKDGWSIVHEWVKIGNISPFKYILSNEVEDKWKDRFIGLIHKVDKENNTPFHVAATSDAGAVVEIVSLLKHAYEEQRGDLAWSIGQKELPWVAENNAKERPLQLAIRKKHDQLASQLALMEPRIINYYDVFLAIDNECYLAANEIINMLGKESKWEYQSFTQPQSGRNFLHLAPSLPEAYCQLLIEKSPPKFISEADNHGNTPLHLASEAGKVWLIEAMLKRNPSACNVTPIPWIKACENGHVHAIRTFINNCPENFIDHCRTNKDSPLHHIKLPDMTQYDDFLKISGMKDLIDVQDSQGHTPLHKAIIDRNILLAESLLKIRSINYCDIEDGDGRSARDMLQELCKNYTLWDQMCKRVQFEPKIRQGYFVRKTNIPDVRSTMSVVAALLATITFTAGFTLPGGFDQGTGEAVLAKKAVFLVFLISDTLAMCCSMLVLICLIWSMVYENDTALFYVDRSMILLMAALYSTLLAFMTGVFIVISPKSSWAAVVVIVMCSLLGISANRNVLFKLLHFIPFFKRGSRR